MNAVPNCILTWSGDTVPSNLDAKLLALFSKSKRELLILKQLQKSPQSSLELRTFFAERGARFHKHSFASIFFP